LFVLSLILGLLSLLSYFVAIPFVTVNLYWFMGGRLAFADRVHFLQGYLAAGSRFLFSFLHVQSKGA
jgi:hypothetical protein